MPLILAIEPDHRQSTQLTTIIRARLHADLVLGDSAECALAALGDRVPDLILTSALLSPKDEGTLGERLRSLNTAVQVQTLTIPVLGSARPRSPIARTLLGALRRGPDDPPVLDGCDPAMFADQCAEYLNRAAAERAALAPVEEDAEPPVDVWDPLGRRPDTPLRASEVSTSDASASPALLSWAPLDFALEEFEVVATEDEPAAIAHSHVSNAGDADDADVYEFDLSAMIDILSIDESDASREADIVAIDLEPATDIAQEEQEDLDEPTYQEPEVEMPTVKEPAWIPPRLGPRHNWPVLEGVAAEKSILSEFATPQDAIDAARTRSARKRQLGVPAQDEWGFFDPDQCGFDAVIAQIDDKHGARNA